MWGALGRAKRNVGVVVEVQWRRGVQHSAKFQAQQAHRPRWCPVMMVAEMVAVTAVTAMRVVVPARDP